MTPEERQLLTALADRIKATPAQQMDAEADALIRQLAQARPDTAYILAQTVLMQDFALRNAQAQITDLQNQLAEAKSKQSQGSGSFLGGLFGGGSSQTPAAGSVPAAGPWSRPAPQPAYTPTYGAPVMQPQQTSSFLRDAATTAVGVAGGALLFEGVQSLFSGHHGGLFGGGYGGGPWGGGGFMPQESLSETTIVNNYYDRPPPSDAGQADQASDNQGDPGYQDADYDPGTDDSGSDFSSDDDYA